MFDVTIDEDNIIYQEGTSEGTQIKYFKDGYWYKLDKDGKEGLTEYLCSKLLTFSNLNKDEYILYEQGKVNSREACRSKNYLKRDEEFITLYRLYYNEFGKNLSEIISRFENVEARIEYVLEFAKKSIGLDLTDYFSKIFTLDRIILNEDRHVNNLAVICGEDGFRPAPIFDNGRSLLTANHSARWNLYGIKENVKRVIAKPFSGSHEVMFNYFGEGFKIDHIKALNWLKTEPESREKDILLFQLERYYF